jgi:hypothetical protein
MRSMLSRAAHLQLALLAAFGAFALFSGCSEEGVTPKCPELPLYDIQKQVESGIDPAIQQQRELAAAQDCVTLAGDATGTGGAGGGPSAVDADND